MNMNQQCALVEKVNGSLRCISSVASRCREMLLPLFSAPGRPHLEPCVQFWPLPYKDILDAVQQRAIKMMKRLGCTSYEKRLEELESFS